MAVPEMVLEYVNSLKWPIVASGALIYLREPLRSLLQRIQSGSVSAGAVTVGFDAAVYEKKVVDVGSEIPIEPGPAVHRETQELEQGLEYEQNGEAHRIVVVEDRIHISDDEVSATEVVPAVAIVAARRLSTNAWQDFQRRAVVVRAYSNLRVDDAQLERIRSAPAEVVAEEGKRLNEILAGVVRGGAPPNAITWPGTPPELTQVFRDLDELRIDAIVEPEVVTAKAAYGFVKSTRVFSGMYGDFLANVIKASIHGESLSAEERAEAAGQPDMR